MKKSLSNTWGSWFEGEKVSEDFMEEREQDILSEEYLEKYEYNFSLTDLVQTDTKRHSISNSNSLVILTRKF